jgi:alpha-1,2-mannosyltransferase
MTSPGGSLKTQERSRPHDLRLLIYVVCSLLVVNVGIWAVYHVLRMGSPGNMKYDFGAWLHVQQWTDSWLPMMKSLDYFRDHPTEPIYYAKLYDTLIYPLPSLFPIVLLRKMGLGDYGQLRVLAWASWLAVWLVGIVSLALARVLLLRRAAKLSWVSVLAVMLACLGFFPLIKGYSLGNAQTFLTLGFAVLVFTWSTGREKTSGVLAAGLAMVKPQYVLLLVWMAMRKKWGGVASGLIFAAVMFGISIGVFGWHNNLDYIAVLASLSHKAQSHYANQSMFGTLNRMVFNGENLPYHPFVYSPYIPWIYRVTVATSLLLVCAVLFFPWGRLKGSTADLAAMGIVSVAASPMAWEHHYGIVFPVFAWVWFSYGCWQERRPWLLGLSFFLIANFLDFFNLLWSKPGWNVLQSYLYFGALLLVFLLMRLARVESREDRPDLLPVI